MKDVRIRIMPEGKTARVDFEIYGQHFHTNDEGEGLWIGYDYRKQVRGTCQFALCQKSRSGKRRVIDHLMEWWSCFLDGEAYEKELEYQWEKMRKARY